MKKLATFTLSAALALTSIQAFADKKTEAAIDYRKSVFTAVRWNFGPMGDMMKGKIDFDAKEFSRRADNVAALSKMPLEGFIPGSYSGDTEALPAIEKNWDKFSKGMEMFAENAAALSAAAKDASSKGDVADAFMKVAKNCKGCHDNFKD